MTVDSATKTIPHPRLAPGGKEALDAVLAAKVAEGKLPALTFGVVSADDELYFGCKGDKFHGQPERGQIDENTTLQLYSQTKFVTSLACLQLYEKGLIDFDDPALIAAHLPELASQPILKGFDDAGEPITTPRKNPLTLRHLLTHTSGLSYEFIMPELLGRYRQHVKAPKFLGAGVGIEGITDPLMFEPGTRYGYGTSTDWAGVLVERVSGQRLQDYFTEHIFAPLGIKTLTFMPTDEVKANMQQMCMRDASGNLVHGPGLRDVANLSNEDVALHSGGGGLFGTARDYLRLLQGVLRCREKAGIIKPETFELLFQSAFPPREEQGKSHSCYSDFAAMLQHLGNPETQYTSGDAITHSLALAVVLADSKFGRKAGSGNWGGIAKTVFWIDPATGIAVMAGTQLTDPVDNLIPMGTWQAFERTLYDNLE